MADSSKSPKSTSPRLNLPFRRRKFDMGRWVYAHRSALLATVILYLVAAICLVTVRISLDRKQHNSEIYYFDPAEMERLQEELERAQELNKLLNEMRAEGEQEEVRNAISNENADINERLRNDKGLNASEIFDNAEAVQQAMRDNRARQQHGEQEIQDMIDRHNQRGNDDGESTPTGRAEGTVMVSYSLSEPLRNAVYLFKPSYKCQGGGTVVVTITVNRNGDVTEAVVSSSTVGDDYCMTTTAVDAALSSRFNIDPNAPERQIGTITYQFVAQ